MSKDIKLVKDDFKPSNKVYSSEDIFHTIYDDATISSKKEPVLIDFLKSNILNHKCLEDVISYRLSSLLGCKDIPTNSLHLLFLEAYNDIANISKRIAGDIITVFKRDPACNRFIEPILYFKGFHAIQTHHIAHWMWNNNKIETALFLQSRSSRVFGVDIHPAAKIGQNLFLDHATSIVVGECTVIGDNVSMLQGVTLGGTGNDKEDRHPKIGNGVLIGAGAKVLGNIKIGNCSRIAAGSVVTKDVKDKVTVAGVPAKIIGEAGCLQPGLNMDQMLLE